jgi:hypothetical protein
MEGRNARAAARGPGCPLYRVSPASRVAPQPFRKTAPPTSREEFGPDIAYREHSFLNHSALPDVVRGSVVHVVSCRHGSVGCATGDNPATLEFNRLFVEERLDSDRLAMWVAPRPLPAPKL